MTLVRVVNSSPLIVFQRIGQLSLLRDLLEHVYILAQSLRLVVIGSAGLLLRAKERGLIPRVRPLMQAMQAVDFHISERVFTGILAAADEI